MTTQEIRDLLARDEVRSLKRLILKMPEPASGVRGRRIRTIFGFAEILDIWEGRVTFCIERSKIERYIKKIDSLTNSNPP